MNKYLWNILVGFDQFIQVILAPLFNLFLSKDSYKFGNPDETISGVMGKNIKRNKCKVCKIICYFLNKIDKNHCAKSIEKDEGN